MIENYANKKIEMVANGVCPKGFPSQILVVARRKLKMLAAAQKIDDLRIPPANRLEALKGDLSGYFSIRINDQFRVIFRFDEGKALDVDIIDYH
jgi:toxin HigB-1